MQNPPHPPRAAAPGRRRGNNRRSVNSPARKTYASENDVPTAGPSDMDFLGQRPFTPSKLAANNPQAPAGSQPSQPKQQKSRSATKPRPKNPSASPGPGLSGQGRNTPPQSGQAKSLAATAYAGATFHASPAPSTLPIPSFLAKALDSPSLKDTSRANQEPSPPATDSEAPTPQHRPLVRDREIAREESPLDLFFRADRAEKERARRASSANVLAVNPGPFSPPTEPVSPQEPSTLPNVSNLSRRRPTTQRNTSAGISSSELDGTPGMVMGPAFSTPYQERLRAATRLASEKQAATAQRMNGQHKEPQLQANNDMSERLKQFLAVPRDQDQNQPAQTVTMSPSRPPQYSGGWVPPKPLQYSAARSAPIAPVRPAAPVAPAPSNGLDNGRPQEILNMEDDLRRMLKISSGFNLGAPSSK
ncbi:hypothetical protein B0T18DRAFT_315692 [Schizothecium vesticola]|uniref:Proteophosphoglycan 5 n=1 Tax=Schizothecium vesticola TaxID=314040 RepID=A0AA40F903_9PEZI|nr:hypothetical protein B0T18DRAFT_315692 [Schizothecium vesticola]